MCYNEHIALCKPIEKYIYGNGKHPLTSYLARSKAPKTRLVEHFKHPRKTSDFF